MIEAHFDLSKYGMEKFFTDNNIDFDAEDCIIRREVSATGKSRAFINDTPVPLTAMRELGEHAPAYHRAAAEKAAEVFDVVYTFGDEERLYNLGAPQAVPAESREALAQTLAKTLRAGDLVFFKGSRLNYLEKIVGMLKDAL